MQYTRNNILTVWIHIEVMQVWILNWYALFRLTYTVHCQVNVAGMHEWNVSEVVSATYPALQIIDWIVQFLPFYY